MDHTRYQMAKDVREKIDEINNAMPVFDGNMANDVILKFSNGVEISFEKNADFFKAAIFRLRHELLMERDMMEQRFNEI